MSRRIRCLDRRHNTRGASTLAKRRPSADEGPHSRDSAPAPHRSSAVASELLTAPPLDGTDDDRGPELEAGAGAGSWDQNWSPAPNSHPARQRSLVCGAVPLDASGVGVPLSAGPGVPAVPPPTEVPLPGSFLTTAATGLPMISSTAVTVTIARANTRPVARAYFFQPMDLRSRAAPIGGDRLVFGGFGGRVRRCRVGGRSVRRQAERRPGVRAVFRPLLARCPRHSYGRHPATDPLARPSERMREDRRAGGRAGTDHSGADDRPGHPQQGRQHRAHHRRECARHYLHNSQVEHLALGRPFLFVSSCGSPSMSLDSSGARRSPRDGRTCPARSEVDARFDGGHGSDSRSRGSVLPQGGTVRIGRDQADAHRPRHELCRTS